MTSDKKGPLNRDLFRAEKVSSIWGITPGHFEEAGLTKFKFEAVLFGRYHQIEEISVEIF